MPLPVGPRHAGQSESVDTAPQTVLKETTRLMPAPITEAKQRGRMALPETMCLE